MTYIDLPFVVLQGIQLEREIEGVEGLRGELLLRGAQRRHLLQRAGDARAAVQAAAQGRTAALKLQARRQAQAALQAGAQDAAIQVSGMMTLVIRLLYRVTRQVEAYMLLTSIWGKLPRLVGRYCR